MRQQEVVKYHARDRVWGPGAGAAPDWIWAGRKGREALKGPALDRELRGKAWSISIADVHKKQGEWNFPAHLEPEMIQG